MSSLLVAIHFMFSKHETVVFTLLILGEMSLVTVSELLFSQSSRLLLLLKEKELLHELAR